MKKGFTLIELLAVIVILAVIAIIAVPIIINIIEDAQKNAAIASAQGYVRAVNYKIAQEVLNDNVINDGDYTIGTNSLIVSGNNLDSILGMYTISNNRVLFAGLCVNDYSIEYNSVTSFTGLSKDVDYCDYEEPHVFIEPEGILLSEVYADETKYADNTYFKIKTVEDLVALSKLVNGGKNFLGKTVYLLSDIDITSDDSYVDSTNTTYGDINGDSTIEGLKLELTTGAGFKPIGTESNGFAGIFTGYAFMIDHLMINRPTETYVGLFGHLTGTTSGNDGIIQGVRIRNASVTGKGNVGTLVGVSSSGRIKNVDIKGDVTSINVDNAGGVVGYNGYIRNNGWSYYSHITEFVYSGTVQGHNLLGGVAGSNAYSQNTISGVVYDTTVRITTSNSQVGKVSTGNTPGGVVMVSVTTTTSPANNNYYNGTSYTNSDMAVFDRAIDTVIGGDSNEDGYYFDYDEDYNLRLYSADRAPAKTKLKGSGTEESPYLITNIAEWKRAATSIDSENPKYYALTKDLDFTNETFYSMGTNANPFNGVFLGNHHKISNVTVSGYDYVGIFGYNTINSVVKDLKFENITITAQSSYAGLFAYNDGGKINGIIGRNVNVTAAGNVGGLVGYNGAALNNTDAVIKNIDIQGHVTSINVDGAGGIVGTNGYRRNNGWSYHNTVNDFVFKGTVEGHNLIGGAIGTNVISDNVANGVVYDTTVKINTSNSQLGKASTGNKPNGNILTSSSTTLSPASSNYNNGISYNNADILLFDKAVDTIIGGDNDRDGYYFDLDSNGVLTLYSTDEKPLPSINGEGTENDPYVIASTDDWRAAVTTIDGNPHYYSLTSDLDFTNKTFYAMGTYQNKFYGTFSGNHHTISNVNIEGNDYVGVFGFNTINATIKDINFTNITITASDSYAGLIAQNDGGKINGVKGRNITVTANGYVGGLIGSNTSALTNDATVIKNIDIQGHITSRNVDYAGGIVGYNGYRRDNGWSYRNTISDFVFKGTVEGHNLLGGAAGSNIYASNVMNGVVYDSTIKINTSNSQLGKATTGNNPSGTIMTSESTTLTPASTNFNNGTNFTTITLEAVNSVIDTTIGGDNDSDGYYFTLTNGEYELVYSN